MGGAISNFQGKTTAVVKGPLFPVEVCLPGGDTAIVVNELCACTHFRTQHKAFDVGMMSGRGACGYPLCFCGQFTWKATVYGSGSPKSQEFVASIGVPQVINEYDQCHTDQEHEIELLTERVEALEKELHNERGLVSDLTSFYYAQKSLCDKLTYRGIFVEMCKRTIILDDKVE